jgi:hypothetical protein
MDVPASPRPTLTQRLWPAVRLHFGRAVACDFTRHGATPEERALLASASPPIDLPHVQDYLAWRRSMVVVGVPALSLVLLQNVISWAEFGEQAAMFSGFVHVLMLLQTSAVAFLLWALVASTRSWTDAARVRTRLRRAWLTYFLVPILICLVPFASLITAPELAPPSKQALGEAMERVNAGIQGPGDQELVLRGFLGHLVRLVFGVVVLLQLAPTFLALFPGITRAGLAVKTLLPGRSTPAAVASLAAPIYAAGFLLAGVTLHQAGGNALLAVGLLVFLVGPLTLARRSLALAEPMERDEARKQVAQARTASRWWIAGGGTLLLVALFDVDVMGVPLVGTGEQKILSPWSLVGNVASFFVTLCVFTVVASDALVAGLERAKVRLEQDAAKPAFQQDGRRLGDVAKALDRTEHRAGAA